MSSIQVEAVGESDIGLVRERNEDVFLGVDLTSGQRLDEGPRRFEVGARGLVFGVLDGMGGAAGGDRASHLASETFAEEVRAAAAESRPVLLRTMIAAMRAANRRIRDEAEAAPGLQGMGTTLTAAALLDDTLILAHVGDSRAYLCRAGRLVQVTEDQSLIQELVASGQIPREEAPLFEHNNVILQALGVAPDLQPFAAEVPLRRGDLLLLCTDGLSTMVPEEEVAQVMTTKADDLVGTVRALTSLARAHGGHDNATVVLARFDGEGLKPTAAEDAPEIRHMEAPAPARTGLSPLALVVLAVLLMVTVAGVILLMGLD